MDFFAHQDQARKRTWHLVLLFAGALVVLVTLLNLLVAALFIGGGEGGTRNLLHYVSLKQWLMVSALVLIVVLSASFVRWLQLRAGGKAVALSLGGVRLRPDSQNFYHRRLLNLVEEMSIAAGIPVPPVYVLPESGINAFAAGYRLSDAVLGVTEGAMTKLSRDQLQGVIAHEFSHIFNGDMRLNIRLMALLFGILFVGLVGRFLLNVGNRSALSSRTNQRRSGGGAGLAVLLLGVGLVLIGYCGVWCGNLIKSAVSRQREFLADASAVQFTRNPSGIADALKVIAGEGSDVRHPNSEEAAHLFFGQARHHFFAWFATHPPIKARIWRIEPSWNGQALPAQQTQAAQAEVAATTLDGQGLGLAAVAAVASASVALPKWQQVQARLHEQARQSQSAKLLIYALLLAKHAEIPSYLDLPLSEQLALDLLRDEVLQLPEEGRLALVEVAIGTLRQLERDVIFVFCKHLKQLMQDEGQPSLFKWCLARLVSHYLLAQFKPASKEQERFYREQDLAGALGMLLSALARFGQDDEPSAQQALAAGCLAGGFGELALRKQVSFTELDAALAKLRRAYPHVKGRLLKALQATAQADGHLRSNELDLLRTVAALLEMPMVLLEADQPHGLA